MALSKQPASIIRPDFRFLETVEKASNQGIRRCVRCLKCSAGCPMAEEMDNPPDRLVRMVQLGMRDEVLASRSLWLCTSCMACSDRCPNEIDVAGVIDTLKQLSMAGGGGAGEPRIAAFHQSFLAVVKRYGRLHEASLIALLKLGSRDWLGDLGVGLRLFLKGKIPPLPRRVRGGGEIVALFQAASRRTPRLPGQRSGD